MFEDAIRAAERSNLMRHRTGCAIYDHKGNLLSIGWSHSQNLQRVHVQTPWSVHAEQHAIERLAPASRDRAYRIVIVTLTKSGNITSGKPCHNCARRIRNIPSIREVIASQKREV